MAKFKKQGVVIDAVQFTGENYEDIAELTGEGVFTISDSGAKLFIPTLEGMHEASTGDWIIRDLKGEFYPCKPDIFALTYRSSDEPITEEWLKAVGFRWHQFDRQPDKHWLLWLGDAVREAEGQSLTSYEDIGLEMTPNRDGKWFCWLRDDAAGRYHRFIHLRHLSMTDEVIQLVVAITGQDWNPENHQYGSCRGPRQAQALREADERLDRRINRANHKWSEVEKDDTRGRALPEHMQAAIDGRKAK